MILVESDAHLRLHQWSPIKGCWTAFVEVGGRMNWVHRST